MSNYCLILLLYVIELTLFDIASYNKQSKVEILQCDGLVLIILGVA
jgi:hypothetical protein